MFPKTTTKGCTPRSKAASRHIGGSEQFGNPSPV